jgi:hypothetical protein
MTEKKTLHQTRSKSLQLPGEFFLKKMSLEDCIAAVAKTGATGIEILGEQSMFGFPKLTDAFVDQWFGWMDKYGVTPVCHDFMLDYTMIKGKYYSDDEALQIHHS